MSNDVWIGALLSVPIGVGTGLAVAPLQRWYRDLGKSRVEVERNLMTYGYGQALFYISHPHRFTQYLVVEVVRAIVATAVMPAAGGTAFATVLAIKAASALNVTHPLTTREDGLIAVWIAGVIVNTLASAYLAWTFQRTIILYKRVINF